MGMQYDIPKRMSSGGGIPKGRAQEGEPMRAETILVSLTRGDSVEEVVPYLEKVVRPGMKVVFLMPYPVAGSLSLRDCWITTESPTKAMLAGRDLMARSSWELQRGLAERTVFPASETLRAMGVDVTVEVYTGSLKRVIGEYTAHGGVHLIMRHAKDGHALRRLLHRGLGLSRWFKAPPSPPMLVFLPGRRP